MRWIRYPGQGPSLFQPWLVAPGDNFREAERLILSQYPEGEDIRLFALRCPHDGGKAFRLTLDTQHGIASACRQCGRGITFQTDFIYSASLPSDSFRSRCSRCGGEWFALLLGLEYPSGCLAEASGSVDWKAEGVDDETVSWLWIAGQCMTCGHTQNIADIEGE